MRRGDQAHVDLDRTRTAEPHERTLFKHTQKLGVHARRHGGDLVEEERAAMSAFEQSFLASTRIREGARLESEQLAFEQRVGQRGAVDCRLRRPCAQLRAPGTAAFALAARCSVFQSSRIDNRAGPHQDRRTEGAAVGASPRCRSVLHETTKSSALSSLNCKPQVDLLNLRTIPDACPSQRNLLFDSFFWPASAPRPVSLVVFRQALGSTSDVSPL